MGRDPPKGTIIPLFRPPAGLSPAGARYLREYGLDDRGFAAALVGLAVKKHLKIKDEDGEFAITPLNRSGGGDPLTPAEGALFKALPSGELKLKQSNHQMVRNARSVLKDALEAEYEGSAFVRNIGAFVKGAIISAVGLVLGALLMPPEDGFAGLFLVGWMSIWWGVVLTFLWFTLKGLFQGKGIASRVGSVFMLLFLVPFVGGGVMAPLGILLGAGSPRLYLLIGTAVLLGVMNLVFFYLLRAPTLPGRKLLDEIEGFRLYMTTAEEERLKVLHPPEKTPELFERYLPYALALDCENEWNAKFASVLAAAAMAGAAQPRLVQRAQLGCRTDRELHRQPGQQPVIQRGLGLDGARQPVGIGWRRIVGRRWRWWRRIGLVVRRLPAPRASSRVPAIALRHGRVRRGSRPAA